MPFQYPAIIGQGEDMQHEHSQETDEHTLRPSGCRAEWSARRSAADLQKMERWSLLREVRLCVLGPCAPPRVVQGNEVSPWQ